MKVRIAVDDLQKASFYADFFCSELAVEVYKNAVREVNPNDRAAYLVNFAEKLWEEIKNSMEDDQSYDLGL